LVSATATEPVERGLCRRAQRFVQAVVEIVEGNRSPAQLLRWTSPRVYHEVGRRARLRSRQRRSGQVSGSTRARVVSVRVSEPVEGVAEVAAHVRHGVRSHALAVRLERREQQWICTALEWG
jgi:hypothetical protein